MRTHLRWIVGLAAVLVVAIVSSVATATVVSNSSVNWPAGCVKFRCVNNHLNLLHAQVHKLNSEVTSLRSRNRLLHTCVAEYPETRYNQDDIYYYGTDSNGDGNFDTNNFNDSPFRFLDQTNSGDNVSIWVLRDSCSPAVFGRPPAP